MWQRLRKENGQALVEFTLMFPIFIGIIIALAMFSILFYSYLTMQLAVREATVYAVEHPKDMVDTVRTIACNSSFALNKNDLTIQVEPPDTTAVSCSNPNQGTNAPNTWVSGGTIAVTAVYNVPLPATNIPVPGGGTLRFGPIPITAKSKLTIE